MSFPQGGDVEFMLLGQAVGNIVKFEFTGSMSVPDTKMRERVAAARGTRTTGMLQLVSGREYEVLEDGNIVITIELENEPATLSSIHSEAAETTAIGGVNPATSSGTTSEEWYDLNGRRMQGKPTTQGLYINNGKKIVLSR